MLRSFFAAAATAALLTGAAFASDTSPFVTAAVTDTGRPAADTARDASRKPAEMVTFAGIKPGDSVLEILPGGGYFTRIFSKVIGPSGHLYAAVPDPKGPDAEPAAATIAASHQGIG